MCFSKNADIFSNLEVYQMDNIEKCIAVKYIFH